MSRIGASGGRDNRILQAIKSNFAVWTGLARPFLLQLSVYLAGDSLGHARGLVASVQTYTDAANDPGHRRGGLHRLQLHSAKDEAGHDSSCKPGQTDLCG